MRVDVIVTIQITIDRDSRSTGRMDVDQPVSCSVDLLGIRGRGYDGGLCLCGGGRWSVVAGLSQK